MKVALSVPGKFHTFDLARELHAQGALAGILTGYPRFKLRHEQLPASLIRTFPWFMAPYMANPWQHRLPRRWTRAQEHLVATTFTAWAAAALPACDVYVGLSGSSLAAGRRQQRQGGRYVCDRGSAHIRVQDALLREEHHEWGLPFEGVDPRNLEREEAEYAQADCITVPSAFAWQSFIRQGVPPQKVRRLPYGVDLARFARSGEPDARRFDLLFVGGMSLQKGVPYLLQAYRALKHPAKSLKIAGTPSPQLIAHLSAKGLWSPGIEVLGHVPQSELRHLMSRSHALVLPSVQDGFGMVLAQAMACGCPVIASENTGARDLFDDGQEGFIVPIRNAAALADRLQRLVDETGLRERMAAACIERVQRLGGWRDYGQRALGLYQQLVAA
jgi:starch synthase